MSTGQLITADCCARQCFVPLSSCSPNEISSLISFLVDICLQSDSRAREQRSIACYILSKWTPELESHPSTYRPCILLTNSSSLDIISDGSPSKKRKMATHSHQKRRLKSEVVRRRTKNGDGSMTPKRKSKTCKSKARKADSTEKLLSERCTQSTSIGECVLNASTRRQGSRRKSKTATSAKRPSSLLTLTPKKSQSSHILLQPQQRPGTTTTVKGTTAVSSAHRPSTSHGSRLSSKFKQTFDCIEQNKNNDDSALIRLFTAVEMTKDETCLILLCRIIGGYLHQCKMTESRRRLRDCVRLDVVGCCLRALHSLLCEPNNEMKRIAENTLAHTILFFSAKDRKFLLKVRLSGIVPMFICRLSPSESANSSHFFQPHHSRHLHNHSPHSLLSFSFSSHPTALFRLISVSLQRQHGAENSQLPPVGSPAAIAKYSRQTETELTLNYQKLFAELTSSATLPKTKEGHSTLETVGCEYETIARVWAQKAKGVVPFVKLAFPDLVECPTDGAGGNILQHFLSEADAEKDDNSMITNDGDNSESGLVNQNALQNTTLTANNFGFNRRVIFDLDQLAFSEPPILLDNEDSLKIGSPVGDYLHFESRFESGNLRKAIQVSPTDYELVLAPDINQCGVHFQWFFFQVSDMRYGVPYTFKIGCSPCFFRLLKQFVTKTQVGRELARLFATIVTRDSKLIVSKRNEVFVVPSFNQILNTSNASVALADNEGVPVDFQVSTSSVMTKGQQSRSKLSSQSHRQQTDEESNTPVKSKTENLKDGKQRKGKTKKTAHKTAEKSDGRRNFFTLRFTIQFPHEADVCYIAYHFPYTYSRLQATLERLLSSTPSTIYVHRQWLTSSLCSNLVPLLTVTELPLEIKCREFVLITARVHPGEANSSWIMHGVIDFLLSSHPLAVRARELFVFKLIPMLNPDGVINGSQRCSLSGDDLNRVWNDPSTALHPTIYHAKGLIQYMVDLVHKRPYVFVDLHGHSRKSNVFMYGNNPDESWRQSDRDTTSAADTSVEVYQRPHSLFPQILDEISDSFSLKDCAFSIAKNKEFSARVTTWRQFGIKHAYTMESTYCGFDQGSKEGRQVKMEDMKLVGVDLVKAMVKLWEVKQQMHVG